MSFSIKFLIQLEDATSFFKLSIIQKRCSIKNALTKNRYQKKIKNKKKKKKNYNKIKNNLRDLPSYAFFKTQWYCRQL